MLLNVVKNQKINSILQMHPTKGCENCALCLSNESKFRIKYVALNILCNLVEDLL